MKSRNSNWLKNFLLPGALAAMEVCWVYPWAVWLATWAFLDLGQPVLNFLYALGLTVLSTLGTKYLLRRNWRLDYVQILVVVGGILAILLAVEGEYWSRLGLLGGYSFQSPKAVALALGAYLWWRGINFGRSRPAFEDVSSSFVVGIVGLMALLLVSIVTHGSPDYLVFQSLAGLYVAGFVVVSLLALSLARLEMIREESRRSGSGLGFNRHWLAILFGVIIFIILVTFVVATFFSFELGQRLAAALALAADGLYFLFYLVLLPVSYLVAVLIYILRYLVVLLRVETNQQPLNRPDFSDIDKLREQAVNTGLSAEMVTAIKWTLLAIVAAVIIYFFVRAVFRYRQAQAEDEIEEIHESLWSWQEVISGLLLLLRRIMHRLLPRPRLMAPGVQDARTTWGPAFETSLAIREVYQRLLARARETGSPRSLSETPYEYLPALCGAIPEGASEAIAITEAYVRARYSPTPASAAEVATVNQSWEKLTRLLTPKRQTV